MQKIDWISAKCGWRDQELCGGQMFVGGVQMDMHIANFLYLQICGISFQNFGFENTYHVCIKIVLRI